VSQPPRVSRRGRSLPRRSAPSRARSDPRANAEIDRVLDKIIASGVDSLTPAERKFLSEISRRVVRHRRLVSRSESGNQSR